MSGCMSIRVCELTIDSKAKKIIRKYISSKKKQSLLIACNPNHLSPTVCRLKQFMLVKHTHVHIYICDRYGRSLSHFYYAELENYSQISAYVTYVWLTVIISVVCLCTHMYAGRMNQSCFRAVYILRKFSDKLTHNSELLTDTMSI